MTKHLEKLLQGCERAAAAGNVPVSDMRSALPTHCSGLAAHGPEWASLADYLGDRELSAKIMPVSS